MLRGSAPLVGGHRAMVSGIIGSMEQVWRNGCGAMLFAWCVQRWLSTCTFVAFFEGIESGCMS